MLKPILRQSSALFILAMALSGCSSLSGYPEPIDDTKAGTSVLATAVRDNATQGTEAQKRADRDAIITGRVHALDDNFREFEKSLSFENGTFTTGADWTQLVLSGLGTALGGQETKTALAAASVAVAGAKGDVDKDVFYSNAMPAIVAAMDARRATVLVMIETGLTKSTDDYPLSRALLDIDDYERAGSIPGAINNILQKAGAEKDTADKAMATIARSHSFIDALPAINATTARISKLKPSQLLAMAKTMEPNLKTQSQDLQEGVSGLYPNWLTNSDDAKGALLMWNRMFNSTSDSQKLFSTALDSAEKTPPAAARRTHVRVPHK